MRRMVHANCGRGCTCLPPCLLIPILRGARRLAIQYQHNGRDKYYCSHRHLQPAVYLDDISSHHISTIALPEFIFRYYLVSVPEVACPEVQGSGTRWRIEACGHKHGAGTDATCDGEDRGTQGPRCRADSMADWQYDGRFGNGKVIVSNTWLV